MANSCSRENLCVYRKTENTFCSAAFTGLLLIGFFQSNTPIQVLYALSYNLCYNKIFKRVEFTFYDNLWFIYIIFHNEFLQFLCRVKLILLISRRTPPPYLKSHNCSVSLIKEVCYIVFKGGKIVDGNNLHFIYLLHIY